MRHLESSRTTGVVLTLVCNDEKVELPPYVWDEWNNNDYEILAPNMFIEIEKTSLSIIREGLKNTPFIPKTK